MTALDQAVIELRRKPPRRRKVHWLALAAWLVVPVLGGQLVFSGMTEGYCLAWPGIGTRFTADFSHRGFARIEPGMTQDEVIATIGAPMGTSATKGPPSSWPAYRRGDIRWSYSSDSSRLGGDWAWLAREVVFREGRVVQTVRWTYYD